MSFIKLAMHSFSIKTPDCMYIDENIQPLHIIISFLFERITAIMRRGFYIQETLILVL